MPKTLERQLRATARKRRYSKQRTDAYVYGTMRRLGLLQHRGKRKRK